MSSSTWSTPTRRREQTVAQLFQANVQAMGFNLELISVDYATIESTVYGDAPPEERPHFIGGWGWWPDYNDPWNQLWPNFTEANIGGGGSNARRLGQRSLRGDHGRGRELRQTRNNSTS